MFTFLFGEESMKEIVESSKDIMYEVVGDQIHIVDMVSGVIMNQDSLYGIIPEDKRIRLSNGVIRKPTWRYSDAYADVVVDLVTQGETLTKITEMPGMPSYQTICKWKTENEGFKKRLQEARKSRGERFHDMIVESLDNDPQTPAEATSEKIRYEKLKYLAEKNNPEDFGFKQTVVGNKEQPIRIVIDTGINRETDTKTLE